MPSRQIKLQEFLKYKLDDTEYHEIVLNFIAEFSSIAEIGAPYFFPEYTEHGIPHIEQVLETSVALITEESKDIFTPLDACLLILSVILHDCGMYVQEKGFKELLSEKRKISSEDLDTSTWLELWHLYNSDMGRCNPRYRFKLFGTYDKIPIPDIIDTNWNKLQRMYIGEFLRRHHHRLAHEITFYGIPGGNRKSALLPLNRRSKSDRIVKLAGLIARSHGVGIRSLLGYLDDEYDLRNYKNSHPIYIMVLLRIADYLHMQADRADHSKLQVLSLRSPNSRQEWDLLNAIEDIRIDAHDDIEVIKIAVNPHKTNIETYLRIREWLIDIQRELDTSWGILGEIYSRSKESVLGISIRRVYSNTDNKSKFGKKAKYVPEHVTYTANDAELLRLMIRPLYGDKPEIAVRELVQNAVDAVHEREHVDEEYKSNFEVIVKSIKISPNSWKLQVIDNGIGMTFETLQNYFLNAGASLRNADTWKKQYQSEDGKTNVMRSGKFGVGALAIYLLADDPKDVELSVTTRYALSEPEQGLKFSATLMEEAISVYHCEKEEPGTIIEVKTSNPPKFMQMSYKEYANSVDKWDWYCLDWPVVKRYDHKGKEIEQKTKLPYPGNTSDPSYHWLYTETFKAIGWTYNDSPAVVCNGILIVDKFRDDDSILAEDEGPQYISIKMPSLSVFDNDARMPLTLDRLQVDFSQVTFMESLNEEVYRNVAVYMISKTPTGNDICIENADQYDMNVLQHKALSSPNEGLVWLLTSRGSVIYDYSYLSKLGLKEVIQVSSPIINPLDQFISIDEGVGVLVSDLSEEDIFENEISNIRTNYELRVSNCRGNDRLVDILAGWIDLLLVVNGKTREADKIYYEFIGANGLLAMMNSLVEDNEFWPMYKTRHECFHSMLESKVMAGDRVSMRGEIDYLSNIYRVAEENICSRSKRASKRHNVSLNKALLRLTKEEKVSLIQVVKEAVNDINNYIGNVTVSQVRSNVAYAMKCIKKDKNLDPRNIVENIVRKAKLRLESEDIKVINNTSICIAVILLRCMGRASINIFSAGGINDYGFNIKSENVNWNYLKYCSDIKEGWTISSYSLKRSSRSRDKGLLASIWEKYITHEILYYDRSRRESIIRHLFKDETMKSHCIEWLDCNLL